MKTGVSIIICCHNSHNRLLSTLKHIQNQNITKEIPWEVILVDNASTDKTSKIAEEIWREKPTTSLEIIFEEKLGLSYARNSGILASSYEYIAFVDDDNWINPNWVETLFYLFKNNPNIGACGGPILPIFEKTPPEWFNCYAGNYTLWDLKNSAGSINHPLCGAGLGLRKRAWERLKESGFENLLTDRMGLSLTSGGDFEMGYALLLNGWQLWYDPALHIQHFIPSSRLQWSYLLKLKRGFGHQSAILEAYQIVWESLIKNTPLPLKDWRIEVLKSSYHLTRHWAQKYLSQSLKKAGCTSSALWEEQKGRLDCILKDRSLYNKRFNTILHAPWNIINSPPQQSYA